MKNILFILFVAVVIASCGDPNYETDYAIYNATQEVITVTMYSEENKSFNIGPRSEYIFEHISDEGNKADIPDLKLVDSVYILKKTQLLKYYPQGVHDTIYKPESWVEISWSKFDYKYRFSVWDDMFQQ